MSRLRIASVMIAVLAASAAWFITRDEDPRPIKAPNPHFFNERAYPKGEVDLEAIAAARIDVRRTMHARGGPAWQPRGPNDIQGRVTALAVDPTDDDVVYAAAAEGGLFRSMNGGLSWVALFDDQVSLSIGAVTLDPSNPSVVYVGTGEVNPGGGSVAYGGTGIYRSDDQGDSWVSIGLENSGSIGRIVVHPTNSDIIHVAVMGHLWASGADRGVYRTDDGGDSWTRVLFVNSETGCVDLIQNPSDPTRLFAAMWERIRGTESYDYGGTGCGVWSTDDTGQTWSLVGGGLPGTSANRGRIGLAVCQSNPSVMCAVYADRTGFFDGLYRSVNGGTTWTRTSDGGLSGAFASYGWWFGNVRIDPLDDDVIYVVGLDMYRSTNGGSSYGQVGSNMHVDHHALAFGNGGSTRRYAGNDGGVYWSTNGSTWTKTSGDLPITQAYRIAVAPWDIDALWIGAQDNGTSQDLNGDGDFDAIYGGDGFQPLPHPVASNRIWAQYQYGEVGYSSNGGSSFSGATSGLNGRMNWNAPHAMNPSNPEERYFGSDRVFRNNGNTSWTAISGDLTGGPHAGQSGQVNGTLTTIAVSPVDEDVIWAGSDDGFVHVTTSGGGSWLDRSAGLPDRWVTSVHPHPNVRETALVTVSGFRWGEDIAHVYRTEDIGDTWTAVGAGLPDVPVNDVFVDPMQGLRYFAATDVGVYSTEDGGITWSVFGAGLPNVVVTDLAYQPATRELVAGTYGRSIFSAVIPDAVDVPPGSTGTPEVNRVLAPRPNPTTSVSYIGWQTEDSTIVSVRIFSVAGRLVWSREFDGASRGTEWPGVDRNERRVASGVYLVDVRADGVSLGVNRLVVRR